MDSARQIRFILARIQGSKKYRRLCEDTIRDVAAQELARHKSTAKALEAARRRLHRVWAGYLGEPDYQSAANELAQAFATGGDGTIRKTCAAIMSAHASSRERLPILAEFYSAIFDRTGSPTGVMDLACALNPLALRWMGLPTSAAYIAYDINAQTVELVNHYFRLEGRHESAELRDVLCSPPEMAADVAFLLKMYHCLEHRRHGAGWTVVEAASARWVAVSFPTRNLSGKSVDIAGNYEGQIRDNAQTCGWTADRIDFETEAVLLIRKTEDGS